jgi:hypothetical protein
MNFQLSPALGATRHPSPCASTFCSAAHSGTVHGAPSTSCAPPPAPFRQKWRATASSAARSFAPMTIHSCTRTWVGRVSSRRDICLGAASSRDKARPRGRGAFARERVPSSAAGAALRRDAGLKMILWAFYRHGSSSDALVQPLRASAQAGDRSGHIKLIKCLCPTEPGSAATSPVLRYLGPKIITWLNSNYRRPPDRFVSPVSGPPE